MKVPLEKNATFKSIAINHDQVFHSSTKIKSIHQWTNTQKMLAYRDS